MTTFESKRVIITPELLRILPLRPCEKGQTEARILTEEDYRAMGGQIQTNEGLSPFQVGDYLGRGWIVEQRCHWPIRFTKMNDPQYYRRLTEPDAEGWAFYKPLTQRRACQLPYPFKATDLEGRAG
jgi:hypothetical protein